MPDWSAQGSGSSPCTERAVGNPTHHPNYTRGTGALGTGHTQDPAYAPDLTAIKARKPNTPSACASFDELTRSLDELTRSLDEQFGLEPTRETRVIYRHLLGQA